MVINTRVIGFTTRCSDVKHNSFGSKTLFESGKFIDPEHDVFKDIPEGNNITDCLQARGTHRKDDLPWNFKLRPWSREVLDLVVPVIFSCDTLVKI